MTGHTADAAPYLALKHQWPIQMRGLQRNGDRTAAWRQKTGREISSSKGKINDDRVIPDPLKIKLAINTRFQTGYPSSVLCHTALSYHNPSPSIFLLIGNNGKNISTSAKYHVKALGLRPASPRRDRMMSYTNSLRDRRPAAIYVFPISSFHRSGFAAIKSRIIRMHSESFSTISSMPRERR